MDEETPVAWAVRNSRGRLISVAFSEAAAKGGLCEGDIVVPLYGQPQHAIAPDGSMANIDAQELMCELHHIAGSEQHDPDVRRTACEAESAIARLIHWVLKLQMNTSEREAVETAVREADAHQHTRRAATLRGLLERHAPQEDRNA